MLRYTSRMRSFDQHISMQHREVRLERLAHEAAALPQEQILRDLLRDRRRTAQIVAGAIVVERVVQRHEVDAVVLDEPLILGRDDGTRGGRRDRAAGAPLVVDVAQGSGCCSIIAVAGGAT